VRVAAAPNQGRHPEKSAPSRSRSPATLYSPQIQRRTRYAHGSRAAAKARGLRANSPEHPLRLWGRGPERLRVGPSCDGMCCKIFASHLVRLRGRDHALPKKAREGRGVAGAASWRSSRRPTLRILSGQRFMDCLSPRAAAGDPVAGPRLTFCMGVTLRCT